jgi:hypothetical protein
MNLLAKRAGLVLAAAVLFLLSCDDDFLLGIKGKTKFQGRYHEIIFNGEKSSVLLLDSVFTDQWEVSASPVNANAFRFLIGSYEDPALGTVNTGFYSQYLPNADPELPTYFNRDGETLTLDSTTIQLWLDFYAYGPDHLTIDDVINIYPLIEGHPDSLTFFKRYINTTTLSHSGELVGQLKIKKFSRKYSGSSKFRPYVLDQIHFKEQSDRSPEARDTIMFQGQLDPEFAFLIFDWIADRGDSALISEEYLDEFKKEFPGLAFVSTKTGRVVGLNPLNGFSRFTFHYNTPTNDSLITALYFTPFPWVGANSFSSITTQRIDALSGLSVPNQRYFPDNDPDSPERYIQDGSGVITELDLSDYYSFIDTLEDIVINSAELSMEVADYAPGISPISSLYGIVMKEEGGKILPLDMTVDADSLKMIQFVGNVFTDLRNFGIATELSGQSPLTLSYDNTSKKYIGYATMFFQKLFINKDNPEYNIEHIGFYPATAPILKILSSGASGSPLLESGTGNTVNRAVLKTSGIKLKLYYTVPNKPNL